MRCLDAPRLFELLAGAGSSEERAALDEHLDGCATCRALVAAYARVADEDLGSSGTISPYARTVASEPPAAPLRASPGARVAGRFVLEHVVGEGGMGVVWAARTLDGDRPVALKMLKVMTPELTQRALREARIAAEIGHPNVVEVHEVLAIDGAPPVLVMELLEGESLDRKLAREGALPLARALAVLVPLASALRAAHARGVVHRDLKPQNVFLARDGDEEVVMLLDFGLAKLLEGDQEMLTKTGAILGTPHYMAPEQLYGERDIDRRADVWAIGVVAFECLTGKRPLEGSSYAQIVRAASRGRTKPLAELLPSAPPRLATLVDRMLAHDRAARPELGEVHAELDAIARAAGFANGR